MYTATYNSTYIDYTIVFKNYDDTVLSTKTYHYGDTVTVPTTPTKESDQEYDYEFTGWDSEVTTVTGDKTYKAQFKRVDNAEYKSNVLLNELIAIIEGINNVDLNTYQTIVDLKKAAEELTASDLVKFNAKLHPVIIQYQNYVRTINNEYGVSKEIENNYFIGILEMINYVSMLGFALLCGKRWF